MGTVRSGGRPLLPSISNFARDDPVSSGPAAPLDIMISTCREASCVAPFSLNSTPQNAAAPLHRRRCHRDHASDPFRVGPIRLLLSIGRLSTRSFGRVGCRVVLFRFFGSSFRFLAVAGMDGTDIHGLVLLSGGGPLRRNEAGGRHRHRHRHRHRDRHRRRMGLDGADDDASVGNVDRAYYCPATAVEVHFLSPPLLTFGVFFSRVIPRFRIKVGTNTSWISMLRK